jgi:hypothetical protein
VSLRSRLGGPILLDGVREVGDGRRIARGEAVVQRRLAAAHHANADVRARRGIDDQRVDALHRRRGREADVY